MTGRGVIAFSTQGGAAIGLGHLRRCLTLAHVITQLGGEARFILNDDRDVVDLVPCEGFEAVGIKDDPTGAETAEVAAKWQSAAIVCDSYEFDAAYFERLARAIPVVVAIDDLADRLLPVSLVVNGSVNAHELVYRTAPQTMLLLGTKYMLLRQEFALEPNRTISQQVGRVLITTGGTDPFILTPRLIRWVRETVPEAALDVVVGPFFPEALISRAAEAAGSTGHVALFHNPSRIRDLMLACDIAITGGGQTTYELAATGTPAIAVRLAANQTGHLSGFQGRGAIIWAGDADDPELGDKLAGALLRLADDPEARRAMSSIQRTLVDGHGAQRVARSVLQEDCL